MSGVFNYLMTTYVIFRFGTATKVCGNLQINAFARYVFYLLI